MMRHALGKLSVMAKMYSPVELQAVLVEYGAELDRLRAEVNDLRSKIETKE
jgi:hypothetical protein